MLCPLSAPSPVLTTCRHDPFEIAGTFEAPLDHFRDPSIHRVENWQHLGRTHPVDFYEFEQHTIWGLTAAILRQFIEETAGLGTARENDAGGKQTGLFIGWIRVMQDSEETIAARNGLPRARAGSEQGVQFALFVEIKEFYTTADRSIVDENPRDLQALARCCISAALCWSSVISYSTKLTPLMRNSSLARSQ